MDPITAALLQLGLSGGSAAFGGLFGKRKGPTQQQQNQQQQIDLILQGLQGQGPYAGMFAADEDAFQKSFVDPAMSRFENYTVPQTQQGYIASGQQRGTGMEDTLTRAGVDMDTLLNQQYGQFQQNAMQNKIAGINAILGYDGQPGAQSSGSAMMQGLGGYLAGGESQNDIASILRALSGSSGMGNAATRGANMSQYAGSRQ